MSDYADVTTAEVLHRMQAGWDDLQTYLKTLTPEQMTRPTDAAGWTAKDHVMHLAVWEDGIAALLEGESRRERMGLDVATWESDWDADHYFHINDVIYQQHHGQPLDDVLRHFDAVHQRLVDVVSALADADLLRPYNSYDPTSSSTTPLFALIVGDTYGHYEQHRPWIAAIVDGG